MSKLAHYPVLMATMIPLTLEAIEDGSHQCPYLAMAGPLLAQGEPVDLVLSCVLKALSEDRQRLITESTLRYFGAL